MERLLFALLCTACVIFILFGARYWHELVIRTLLAINTVASAPIAVAVGIIRRKRAKASKGSATHSAEPPPADLDPWHTADKRARDLWAKGIARRRK
jgi:hypothetical protein